MTMVLQSVRMCGSYECYRALQPYSGLYREMACPAVAAAAAAALVVGGTLLGTSIEEISKLINTDRNVAIQISNYSYKYILTNPRVFTSSGYSHRPPHPTIQKRTIEACSFTKTKGTACGAVGVLKYEICKHDDNHWVGDLVIMFSVPYDYNLYENWFAIGISKEHVSCDEHLFNQMYYDNGSFTRAKSTGNEIKFTGKHSYVKGTMSPASKSIINAAAAATAPLKAGGSLFNTNIQEISKQINTERNVTIQLNNYSHKYILKNPRVFTSMGHCHIPPQPTIQKRTMEACSFTETTGTARGAAGVLIYEISKQDDRDWVGELAMMFSVPYGYDMCENCFAVGIFEEHVYCDEQLFNLLYYSYGPFTRAKSTGSEISFSGKCIHVKGTMSPANRSTMYVELWD
ncbi:hypothetical protein NFI96_028645, partial [Prochilodus magdalenae]